MLSSVELLKLQQEQHAHDLRNHLEIVSLHKEDRLKHYGLHYCKYVGRLARGPKESKTIERTIVDTFLVTLSAANTLHQDLRKENFSADGLGQDPSFEIFADAAGRFADACEKIDHLEEFVSIARHANRDVLLWAISAAERRNIDIISEVEARRAELAARHFYIGN
jgi:hypothetical protein